MPFLTLDDNLTSFFYLDSGKPQQEIYRTLVIIHGHTFHSGIFRRLLPLAASKGLRLICLNRRDYEQTTLYSPDELKVLAEGTQEERTAFVEARSVEIAVFLSRLVDELSLPPPTDNGNNGGIALIGWSFGNSTSLSVLAASKLVPAKVYQRLQVYLRKFVIFAPPSVVLGLPDPDGYCLPLSDETIPLADRGAAFAEWAAGYYTHGDLSTQNIAVLNVRNQDAGRKSTVATMAPEDFMSTVDFAAGNRSDNILITLESIWSEQAHKVLLDRNFSDLWPNLDVWCLLGEKEPWNVQYAGWDISKRAKAGGIDVKMRWIPGANHFMIWDEPEKTIEELVNAVCG